MGDLSGSDNWKDLGKLSNWMESIRDRLKGPVTGTFATAWVLYHWRMPLIIVFGSGGAIGRIDAIRALFPSGEGWLLFREVFLIPAVASLLYLVAVPLLREAYARWEMHSAMRLNKRRLIDQQELHEISSFGALVKNLLGHLRNDYRNSRDQLEVVKKRLDSAEQALNKQLPQDLQSLVRGVEDTRVQVETILSHMDTHLGPIKNLSLDAPGDVAQVVQRMKETANRILCRRPTR